jgi:hypothetical protein
LGDKSTPCSNTNFRVLVYKQNLIKDIFMQPPSVQTDEQAGYEAGSNTIRQNNYKSLGLG